MEGRKEEADWVRMNAELSGRESNSVMNPHSLEERSRDLTETVEGYVRDAHREEYHSMENDCWALMKVSEELSDIMEERDEFWLLQYRKDEGFVPLLRTTEDEIVVDEEANYDEAWLDYSEGESVYRINIGEIADQSPNSGALLGRNERTDQIGSMPWINVSALDQASEEALDGRYVAPGFEEAYRAAAEQKIERTT